MSRNSMDALPSPKITAEGTVKQIRIGGSMTPSCRMELYCGKCRKMTTWFLVWEVPQFSLGRFASGASMDGWAAALFPLCGICSECETRVHYYG